VPPDERPCPVGHPGETVTCPRLRAPGAHLAGLRVHIGVNEPRVYDYCRSAPPWLPLDVSRTLPPLAVSARQNTAMTHQPSAWRIVVTDDDPKLMAFLVSVLQKAGNCVFAAYDGDSACELALMLPRLDLLVTNTRLGTISGRELIRQVRAEKPGLPILHIGEPLPNPDGLLADVPSLAEPFTEAQLLAQVRGLLGKQRA
jgi:CheY-like chemotaxis protein